MLPVARWNVDHAIVLLAHRSLKDWCQTRVLACRCYAGVDSREFVAPAMATRSRPAVSRLAG